MINKFINMCDENMKNPVIKELTKKALAAMSPSFWKEAASSTGKYHPYFSQGDGGLARHVYAAALILKSIYSLEMYHLTDDEKDIALAAILLHDSAKRGIDFEEKNTMFTHPILVKALCPADTLTEEEKKYWDAINVAIASHMGQWNTSKYAPGEVLPKPDDYVEVDGFPNIMRVKEIVHLADYLASRKGWTPLGDF